MSLHQGFDRRAAQLDQASRLRRRIGGLLKIRERPGRAPQPQRVTEHRHGVHSTYVLDGADDILEADRINRLGRDDHSVAAVLALQSRGTRASAATNASRNRVRWLMKRSALAGELSPHAASINASTDTTAPGRTSSAHGPVEGSDLRPTQAHPDPRPPTGPGPATSHNSTEGWHPR